LQQQLGAAIEDQHMHGAKVRPQAEEVSAPHYSDRLVLLVNHIDEAGERRRGHVSRPTTGKMLTDPASGSVQVTSYLHVRARLSRRGCATPLDSGLAGANGRYRHLDAMAASHKPRIPKNCSGKSD
jgi:hypothetical protein